MGGDSDSSAGRTVDVEWGGRQVRAWVPAPLVERDLALSTTTARVAERAVAALQLSDARLPPDWEPLARLLLRHEGVASSGIEGLREPVESVLVAERTGAGGTAGWVADNLTVIDTALDTADEPLTTGMLHRWHERLMRHGRLPAAMVGRFRSTLGWVGGASPADAAYVPPPPDAIPALIDDLVAFADDDGSDVDAVSLAALAHAQFEAIHPYGDGNGRLGRVLVSRVLRRRGVTGRSTAPISVAIARDPGGYLSGLHLFEQGNHDPWVRWFAETATRAATATEQMVAQAGRLLQRWTALTSGLRADHTALALLHRLPGSPVLNAQDVSALLGVSERSGRTALGALAARGVLSPIDDVREARAGRSRRWYAATELLDLWTP